MNRKLVQGLLALAALLLLPGSAAAFCGFYVAGGDAKLFNEATQVVLMRNGDMTALSMQNNYEGPPTGFAMVVPVPQVLQKENVKTLEKSAFDKIDNLSAPRLVEYWEQDPCAPPQPPPTVKSMRRPSRAMANKGAAPAVKIEAQFKVGEYDIVVLSATESTALDRWLKQEKYNIPDGAEPFFKPYIEGGQFFFVARVDPEKVKYEDGRAVLSPLRFHYTSEKFQLPIRLGMINSKGTQDLLVYILAQNQRFEVANYKNAFIPTNIDVADGVRDHFGDFYRALFDRTQEATKGVVITEYAWDAGTCDPCPGPTLGPADYLTFGSAEVGATPYGWVLTRLHARYSRDDIGEDLVFQEASPVVGGREVRDPKSGALEQSVRPDARNNFQGRYIIRHEWSGDAKCDNPQYGNWGGPPNGGEPPVAPAASPNTVERPARLGAPVKLEDLLAQSVPEIGFEMSKKAPAAPETEANAETEATGETAAQSETAPPEAAAKPKSCAGCAASGRTGGSATLIIIGLFVAVRRRRRGQK